MDGRRQWWQEEIAGMLVVAEERGNDGMARVTERGRERELWE